MLDNNKAFGAYMQISNSNIFYELDYKIDDYTGESLGLLVRNTAINSRILNEQLGLDQQYMTFLIYTKGLAMLDGGPEMLDVINSKITNPEKAIKESDIIVNNLVRIFPELDLDKETKMDILSLCDPMLPTAYAQVVDFSFRLQRNALKLSSEGMDPMEIFNYTDKYISKATSVKVLAKLSKGLKSDLKIFKTSTDTSHIDEHIDKYNKDEISKKEFLDKIFNNKRIKKKNVTNKR